MKTAVFDTINSLKPFFFSLREIKDSVSLDIKIPANWKFGNYKENQIKVQDKNERNVLISIVDTATKEGYDTVFNVATKIIKENQEEEEKIKLFNDKIEELKKIFLETPLDKLKEISFNKDNVRNKKGAGKIGLGDTEGQRDNGTA